MADLDALRGRVFGVGLSRTGTTSLNEALNILGFRSIHFPRPWEDLSGFDAATDTPCALHFRRLATRNPEAKFILTRRDPDSWLKSMRWFFFERPPSGRRRPGFDVAREAAYVKDLREKLYGTLEHDPARLRRAFAAHEVDVREYFAQAPGRLLEIDLFAGHGWDRLCPFLGKDVPAEPFPLLNARPLGK